MAVMNLTALGLYRLTGQFNAFHVGALMSLATVVAGMVPAVRRQPRDRWLRYHFEFMSWSYVGLMAGAVSEAATRLPQAPFWGAVVAGSAAVFVLGGFLVVRARSTYFGTGDRAESLRAGPLS